MEHSIKFDIVKSGRSITLYNIHQGVFSFSFKTYCFSFFDHFVLANSADLGEMLHNISSKSSPVCYIICFGVTPNLKGVKKIILGYLSSVRLYHVCHCPDNNGMIEKDNTSLFSSMHTPVSSGQFVFIMYIIALITIVWLKRIIPAYLVVYTPVSSSQCVFIMYVIALITMVWLKMIIPAYLVVCIHQFHQVSVSLSCISLPW